jgi:fructosamine-3-kinase
MVEAEAEYLRLVEAGAPELPVPRFLYGALDWMFMTRLAGVSMPDLLAGVDTAGVRFESGAAIARLHRITGEFFGYSGERPRAGTWREAYHLMIEALLHDAIVWDVPLPVDPDEIRAVVAAQATALDTVTAPSSVHFDLWDGNVLSSPDGRHLTGMVDGERYLWGDPFIDFASPAPFRDILDTPDDPFLCGYTSVAPLVVDDCVRRRVALSQLYLYLVMIVEFPSRGMSFETDEWRWVAQRGQVQSLIAKLAR